VSGSAPLPGQRSCQSAPDTTDGTLEGRDGAVSGRLHGRAAVVTGGSRGIGLAVARRLLDEGARVVVTATTQDGADRAAAALDAGDRLVALRSDAGSRDDVAAALDTCRQAFGPVDIAVANAGIERPAGLLEVEDADWRAVLRVDLDGAFLLTQLAAREMVRHGRGRIVLVSSTNAFAPEAGSLAYNVAKAGVVGLARAAALEVAAAGVTVNAVGPGLVGTDMTAAVVRDPRMAAWYRERIPVGRFGSPADVSGAVAFLASDDAAWITGHHLVVDGGQTVGLDLPKEFE
jgi:NAD(P)-dependent dehydrogenase (short-subunit alcohol dehydrogenase family)